MQAIRKRIKEVVPPTPEQLREVFELKYGQAGQYGWNPVMRRRFGYFDPDDYYEALVNILVEGSTKWLDVGGGRSPFPNNPTLAANCADRCAQMVGVDPDDTINDNPYVHKKIQGTVDDAAGLGTFDLVTMRMVAEHVTEPSSLVASLGKCTHAGSVVVIYTVNRNSPVPLITRATPFALHHPVKRILWKTEVRDTFPTCFRMNTRKVLRSLMNDGGFREVFFQTLDDCRTFARFKPSFFAELMVRNACRKARVPYPENCLLGAYRREGAEPGKEMPQG